VDDLRISLVIPAYNEERHIRSCLDSVAAQTVKPYEVIVVNNNSTDSTTEIASSYDFVTLIHESKQGIIFARNAGFAAAHGDIIARIDGDSILPKNWMEYVGRFFVDPRNESYIGITGTLYFVDRGFRNLWTALHRISYFGVAALVYWRQVFYGGSMAFRASALPHVWKYAKDTTNIHEDVDLTLALASLGKVAYRSELRVGVSYRGTVNGSKKMLRYLVILVSFWRYRPLVRR